MTITLIIPCYNEEVNIQKGVLDRIGNFTQQDERFVEVLIVDDGSTDKTKKIIKDKYLGKFPKFSLIENAHQGKAFAVITGIEKAKSSYVLFSDIDLATPLDESEKLIDEAKKGTQIIIGSRNSTRQGAPLMRKVMAVGFIFIRNFLIGLRGVRDTQCGFKMFDTNVARTIILSLIVFKKKRTVKGSSVSAGFDLEFLFLANKMGYKIKEIPVTWRHVETKNVNFITDAIETMKDILKIKFYDLRQAYRKK